MCIPGSRGVENSVLRYRSVPSCSYFNRSTQHPYFIVLSYPIRFFSKACNSYCHREESLCIPCSRGVENSVSYGTVAYQAVLILTAPHNLFTVFSYPIRFFPKACNLHCHREKRLSIPDSGAWRIRCVPVP